jgi:DNA polymerase phi
MKNKRKRSTKETSNGAKPSQKRTKTAHPALSLRDAPPQAAQKKPLERGPFPENPTTDDRKREVSLYEQLGSEDVDQRIEAADIIVSGLLGGEGVSEDVLERHLERRLFRGLASGRNASRLGFSLVITEILDQLFGRGKEGIPKYRHLTFNHVLGYLVDNTLAVGNIPGQEERDHYFGQLFGLECFVKAKVLFDNSSRWEAVLSLLLKLASKKVWLRSQCGWIIVQAMPHLQRDIAEDTLKRLAYDGMAKTPEGVGIWLVALDRFPDLRVKPWKHPLANKSLPELAAVLKESLQDENKDRDNFNGRNKQANWTAQLHFVWDLILGHYLRGGENTESDFSVFWARAVDGTFDFYTQRLIFANDH